MANSYKKVGNKNVATLKENASNASKVAEQAYSNSVAKVNAITNNARQKAINNYNASRQRLGKVSQTSKNKLEVGYGSNLSALNTAQKNAENAMSAAKTSAQALSKQAYYTGKANSVKTYGMEQIKKTEADRQAKMKIYKSTVSRFDTVAKCDAAIKKLKKSSDPNKKEKIAYIQNQRATLKAQQRSSGGGGGWHSYGGWGGYSRYSSGGGGGSTEVTIKPKEGDKKKEPEKKSGNKLQKPNIYVSSSRAVANFLGKKNWKKGAAFTSGFNKGRK